MTSCSSSSSRRRRLGRCSTWQRLHAAAAAAASALMVFCMLSLISSAEAGGAGGHGSNPLHTVHNCGTSRIISVTCLMDPRARAIVDVVTTDADGERSALCDAASEGGMNEQTYDLVPGDNVYGVQACYVDGRLTGMTFSSTGGALVCGDPYDTAAECQSTVVAEQAPMSVLTAECRLGAIERMTRVCFNANYVNPVISVTTCPPGQGRTDPSQPCKPCARNTYNPGGLQAECLPCPPGLVTIAEGASRCGCAPGFGANPNKLDSGNPCTECPPGTYSPGGNLEPCWRCRGSAFLTTQPGAVSIVQCVCRPGYGAAIDAPNTCQPCPKGTFSNSLADAVDHAPFDSLARWPFGTGNGKGKGGCYNCNPSWKACTSCCESSELHECKLTTARPGAVSFAQCRPPEDFFAPAPDPNS